MQVRSRYWSSQNPPMTLFDIEKLLLRSKYNHEIETLKFNHLVAQQTIEQLRQELKLKEEIINLKQQNSGRVFIRKT